VIDRQKRADLPNLPIDLPIDLPINEPISSLIKADSEDWCFIR